MKKVIKVKIYNREIRKDSANTYTIEEDGKYPLNNDGSVSFSYLEDNDLFSVPLRIPYYSGWDEKYIDDILEIDGKFGIYDWNMNLIGELYNRIEDVPGLEEEE